ncbi:NADPH-dependent F420 reductase [Brenneria izbisi]|uniref:NADPH-dependent F420 reductase n=1 Tax=Brenneria izbisi TaxID=2939450 RepID=A0AA41Y351_9GAMM|nr:NADPH-dependent F420 reductase [Brenneria izbisi]MCV9878551.1 NADPH-dependent F420 reductase [Brenneria izbisi]MCV9881974.1 NADPH-dependent F420 reductase [Brenneria izbisi]
MKIAVIGTGNIGTAYARALAEAKFDVVIGHRDPSKAAVLAQEIGSQTEGGGIAAALKLADIAILALPYPAVTEILSEAGDLAGKVLVDVSNPVSADFQDLVVGLTTSAAEQIQAAAPTARVVKAFNTIFAGLVSAEARAGKSLQVFVAGDDAAANTQVSELAEKLGFVAVNAGPLRNSRFLEPVGMMNIQFGFFLGAGPTTAPSWAHA